MASRSPQPSRDILPLSDPDRTTALWLVRCSDSPDDPLRIVVDHALLDKLGWRPGDRITFDPIALDRRTREGGLIIRRATADEPAIKLRRSHYERRRSAHSPHFPDGPDGPDVQWPFPPEWIEGFFPLEYIPGPGPPLFANPDRQWSLRDLLDQRERVVVSLGCSLLELRMERTDPNVPTLDVHLPAGVLHLMGWSPATPLALTSRSGFDPSAPDDILTIRRASPRASNLAWDGAKFLFAPDQTWLDRYFPGLHDNTEELPTRGPAPMPPATGHDRDEVEVLPFRSQTPPDMDPSFEDEKRDTFCVHFSAFRLGQGGLSFEIPETSQWWE